MSANKKKGLVAFCLCLNNMVLSDRERSEVRSAVLEYLRLCGSSEDVLASVEAASSPSQEGALEKRWGTIRRLSSKNVELESQVRSLQQELTAARSGGSSGRQPGPTANAHGVVVTFRPLVPSESPLATLRGHRDTITSLSFHPTEALCFSSSEDGSVRAWDTAAMILVATIRPHTDTVNQVAVETHVGEFIATCSNDRTLKLFRASANAGVGKIDLECVRTLLGHDDAVSCVCWLGDEERSLISGSRNGDIRIWNTDKCVTKHAIHTGVWIRQLAVPVAQPPGGTTTEYSSPKVHRCVFASCGNDERITVRNSDGSVVIGSLGQHDNVVHAIAFSHFDADCVLAEFHGSESLRREMEELKLSRKNSRREMVTTLSTGEVLRVLEDPPPNESELYEVKFIASGGRDKTIRVFEIRAPASSPPVLTFPFHENWIRGLHFTRSGKYLVSVADDGHMLVNDLTNGRLHRRIHAHDHFTTAVAFATDFHETLVATGSADTTLKLWRCS